MTEPYFLYFGLDAHSRELLSMICGPTEWVELAPLDKGLSGSLVLMGRWSIAGASSKFHVFKIGNPGKLRREYEAINGIAAPLVRNFPNAHYQVSADGTRAILSQEFMGDSDGSTRSLRQYIEAAVDESEVTQILNRLYTERIIDWLPKQPTPGIPTTVGEELKSWVSKGNFQAAVEGVGRAGVEASLKELFSVDVARVAKLIKLVLGAPINVEKGPIHGDLHSQNIIVDHSNRISLIDFGWTGVRWRAIDYLWLECSLKFVVASPYARLDDLIYLDEMLDRAWDDDKALDTTPLDGRLEGRSLKNIAAGIGVIRRHARAHVKGLSLADYRKGLIGMMDALTTFPQLNRAYLLHSMARNAIALEREVSDDGPYRRLYRPSEILWPSRPGRMVKKAADQFGKPGRALDIGCGDGKDIVFLDDRGWFVNAFDINRVAVANVEKRVAQYFGPRHRLRGEVFVADASKYAYSSEEYDLVVAYGLYHCLDDDRLAEVHRGVVQALRPGGLFAFASFNDTMPVPDEHGTDDLFLRPPEHIFDVAAPDFDVVDKEIGTITEVHPPLNQDHSHGLTWALLRKK